MATIKHGAHTLDIALANATAAVTNAVIEWPYVPSGWFTRGNVDDPTLEKVLAGAMVVGAGTFTNWSTLQITHFDVNHNVIDRVSLVGSGPTANQTQDITTLAASTGNTLAQGWSLNPGDSLELLGTSSAAAPGVGLNLLYGVPS